MRSFFKIFFASFLAMVVFLLIGIFIIAAIVGGIVNKDRPRVAKKSVLVINLAQMYSEQEKDDVVGAIAGKDATPGLYDVVRLIENAKNDDKIAGIYLEADANANGFANSNELRNAIRDFRTSKKFVMAYGDVMTQGSYFIASAADKIYVNPSGAFEWKGYAVTYFFVKNLLDKLQIEPQIFYAGKFKSATEIFRTTEMTPENELQTREWLGDLYNYFLTRTAEARGVDTAQLRNLANTGAIQTPQDALTNKLIDGIKYDDEVKAEIKQRLGIGKDEKIELIDINKYNAAVTLKRSGKDRVAIIYAQGNIVDGMGSNDQIGGENYRRIIRKARLDNSVKAIVLRVNSGGGSALASEIIWRELQQAKKDGKPVVVSFGDVAASGGYYIACGADSIFASANTITGSIGVFGVIPNMQGFFSNKLGVTFDGVGTGPYADGPAVYRPLTENEKQIVQKGIDRIYLQFKQRVAEGRKKDINYVDSFAQGRVWSGEDALRIGLIDRIGSLQDAIRCAAKMARLSDHGVKEYPESKNWLDELLGREQKGPEAAIRQQIGEDNYRIYQELNRIKEITGAVQARLPFEFVIK